MRFTTTAAEHLDGLRLPSRLQKLLILPRGLGDFHMSGGPLNELAAALRRLIVRLANQALAISTTAVPQVKGAYLPGELRKFRMISQVGACRCPARQD